MALRISVAVVLSMVRLSDVAEVIDATENIRNEGQANGKRSVLVILYMQPNANIIETVDEVKRLLPELQQLAVLLAGLVHHQLVGPVHLRPQHVAVRGCC